MKKLISLVLVALCLVLSGCQSAKETSSENKPTTTTQTKTIAETTKSTTTQKSTTTAKPTTTTITTQATIKISYDKLTELKEINNYSTAKDYLTNASDKDKMRLILKDLEIDDLKGVIKNFTPTAYDTGDDKTPEPYNEYGYYAKIQLSKDVYESLAKDFKVEENPRYIPVNKQFIQEEASWWDISRDDVRYYRSVPRGAYLSNGKLIMTVHSKAFLVDNNTEYYMYVQVGFSRVSEYYIRYTS